MKKKPTIYLAGPIVGMSVAGATEWRASIRDLLHPHIDTYSPFRHAEHLSLVDGDRLKATYDGHPLTRQKGIMGKDHWMTTRCDLVIANFTGAQQVSIGTVMECGWAYTHHIPVILVMDEGGIHDHPMLKETAAAIVDTVEEAALLAIEILLSDSEFQAYNNENLTRL